MILDSKSNPLRDQQRDLDQNDVSRQFLIEVFFDGDCPLCRREIEFIKKRDPEQRIRFTDLQNLDFAGASQTASVGEQTSNETPDFESLMAEIHGRLPDGTWIKGVEVFRRLYDAIGWTWLVAITRWPIVRGVLDWAYRMFAPRRLWLTGRSGCDARCQLGNTDQ